MARENKKVSSGLYEPLTYTVYFSLILKYNKLITERRNRGWSIDMIKLGVVISHQEI